MIHLFIYIYPLIFRLFSHIGHCRVLSRVPCAIMKSLHACLLTSFSCAPLFVTLWTVAHQAPLSMGVCRQEYWSGLPCPPEENFSRLRIEPESPALQADSWATREAQQTLSSYLLYIVVCISQSQSSQFSLSCLPPVTISLFSTSVTLFLFCRYVHLYSFLRFHI